MLMKLDCAEVDSKMPIPQLYSILLFFNVACFYTYTHASLCLQSLSASLGMPLKNGRI